MRGCADLRIELERLTNPPGGAAAVRLDDQPNEIAALGAKYPHGITLHEPASITRQSTNCIMFALGLGAADVADWCDDESVHPSPDFMAWLMAEKLVPKSVEPDGASDGDIVVYLREDFRPTHAGFARAAQVISKWGSRGTHIWRHGAFEIPSSYGDHARVYEPISVDQAILAFREWAEPQL